MITILFDDQFNKDLKQVKRSFPRVMQEIKHLLKTIEETETIPPSYNPHILDKADVLYSGYQELHLFEGRYDLVLIYKEHHSQKIILFVRIGSHQDLFYGRFL